MYQKRVLTLSGNKNKISLRDAISVKHEKLIQAMLDAGDDINGVDQYGYSHLNFYVVKNRLDLVTMMITKFNANPNIVDRTPFTPLAQAIYRNNLPMATLLIEKHNADVNFSCKDGRTPLYMAAKSDLEGGMVELLLRNNADVDGFTFREDFTLLSHLSPIIGAIKNDHHKNLKQLIVHGATRPMYWCDAWTEKFGPTIEEGLREIEQKRNEQIKSGLNEIFSEGGLIDLVSLHDASTHLEDWLNMWSNSSSCNV